MGRSQNTPLKSSALTPGSDEQLRRRIATELRNSTLQAAAALSMNLGVIKRLAGLRSAAAQKAMEESLHLARQCEQEIRIFSFLLHPSDLEEFGLNSAVASYLTAFSNRNGCKVNLEMKAGFCKGLPRPVELILFRAVQESLLAIQNDSARLERLDVRCLRSRKNITVEIRSSLGPTASRNSASNNLDPGLIDVQRQIEGLQGEMTVSQMRDSFASTLLLPLR